MNRKFVIIATLTILLALLSTACQQGDDRPADEVVQERAQARWDHLLADEFDQAWEFLSPGAKDLTPRSDFVNSMSTRPVRWVSARVEGAECEPERCVVRTRINYRAVNAPMGQSEVVLERVLEGRWILVDGTWQYSP